MPEVGSGISQQPSSPSSDVDLQTRQYQPRGHAQIRREERAVKEHLRGQALTIAELCERELCEILAKAFLGERRLFGQDSLVMGVYQNNNRNTNRDRERASGSRTPSPPLRAICAPGGARLEAYFEILDYVGGNTFHGFVAQKGDERGLFVFLGEELLHQDLKAGIVAILELASNESMEITQVVACVDRGLPEADLSSLTRDLGWVGFEMTTLAPWTDGTLLTSDEWLLLSVET